MVGFVGHIFFKKSMFLREDHIRLRVEQPVTDCAPRRPVASLHTSLGIVRSVLGLVADDLVRIGVDGGVVRLGAGLGGRIKVEVVEDRNGRPSTRRVHRADDGAKEDS